MTQNELTSVLIYHGPSIPESNDTTTPRAKTHLRLPDIRFTKQETMGAYSMLAVDGALLPRLSRAFIRTLGNVTLYATWGGSEISSQQV